MHGMSSQILIIFVVVTNCADVTTKAILWIYTIFFRWHQMKKRKTATTKTKKTLHRYDHVMHYVFFSMVSLTHTNTFATTSWFWNWRKKKEHPPFFYCAHYDKIEWIIQENFKRIEPSVAAKLRETYSILFMFIFVGTKFNSILLAFPVHGKIAFESRLQLYKHGLCASLVYTIVRMYRVSSEHNGTMEHEI